MNQLDWNIFRHKYHDFGAMPFPISSVAIAGTFLLINPYLRRRMIARMSSLCGNSTMGGMIDLTTAYDGSLLKYYCMSCGTQHKQAVCPESEPKIKRIG